MEGHRALSKVQRIFSLEHVLGQRRQLLELFLGGQLSGLVGRPSVQNRQEGLRIEQTVLAELDDFAASGSLDQQSFALQLLQRVANRNPARSEPLAQGFLAQVCARSNHSVDDLIPQHRGQFDG